MNEGTILLDLTVPTEWPPNDTVKLFEGMADGATVLIYACPNQTLHFDVRSEQYKVGYDTPLLVLPDFAFLRIAFAWGCDDGPSCAINGQLINPAEKELVELRAFRQQPTYLRNQLNFNIPKHCSDVEETLLRFVLDLQARIVVRDRFNLREASAILRRLLLDARPIIHLVNRNYRQKLWFPFIEERHINKVPDGSTFRFVNLCPEFADPAEIELISLDKFLAVPVVWDKERSFTVRDVIDVSANLKGGIHFDEPVSQEQRSLIKLDKRYLPDFVDASFAALPGIGWSTISSARPLVDEIVRVR